MGLVLGDELSEHGGTCRQGGLAFSMKYTLPPGMSEVTLILMLRFCNHLMQFSRLFCSLSATAAPTQCPISSTLHYDQSARFMATDATGLTWRSAVMLTSFPRQRALQNPLSALG